MSSDAIEKWRKDFFTLTPRRKTIHFVLDPAHQLRVPLYLLLITLAFAGGWVASVVVAFRKFYRVLEAEQPAYFETMLQSQVSDLALITLLLGVTYAGVILTVSVIHSHRLVGPGVALRRQIERLKQGDYSARIQLRKRDAFRDVADELNELTQLLQDREHAR